jgi:hypothetical protein
MTLDEHNGSAVHGELVINMDVSPPSIYIADGSGNLLEVANVSLLSGGANTTIPAENLVVQVGNSGSVVEGGSQFLVNSDGKLTGSWLLTLDEANSIIITQANTFVFGGTDLNLGGSDKTVQLPDGGELSSTWNVFQATAGTVVQGVTFPPLNGAPPASQSLSGDFSIPVQINNTNYYIHLSSTP